MTLAPMEQAGLKTSRMMRKRTKTKMKRKTRKATLKLETSIIFFYGSLRFSYKIRSLLKLLRESEPSTAIYRRLPQVLFLQ